MVVVQRCGVDAWPMLLHLEGGSSDKQDPKSKYPIICALTQQSNDRGAKHTVLLAEWSGSIPNCDGGVVGGVVRHHGPGHGALVVDCDEGKQQCT